MNRGKLPKTVKSQRQIRTWQLLTIAVENAHKYAHTNVNHKDKQIIIQLVDEKGVFKHKAILVAKQKDKVDISEMELHLSQAIGEHIFEDEEFNLVEVSDDGLVVKSDYNEKKELFEIIFNGDVIVSWTKDELEKSKFDDIYMDYIDAINKRLSLTEEEFNQLNEVISKSAEFLMVA